MINHYASQSQTCQLLKILKNIFFFSNKENVKSGNQVELIYKIHINYREVVYIYIWPVLSKKGPYVKIFEFEFMVVSEKACLADSKSGFSYVSNITM